MEWNTTSGDCIHSLGLDLSLDSITQYVTSLATTTSSTVALIDRTSNVLLAHNGDFAQFRDDDTAFPADQTPSAAINDLVRQFNRDCTGTCTRLVDIGDNTVTASYSFQSESGLNLLLVDITPRRYYYGLFDDNRRTGIIVAAVVPFAYAGVFLCACVSKPLKECGDDGSRRLDATGLAKPIADFLLKLAHQSYQTMHPNCWSSSHTSPVHCCTH